MMIGLLVLILTCVLCILWKTVHNSVDISIIKCRGEEPKSEKARPHHNCGNCEFQDKMCDAPGDEYSIACSDWKLKHPEITIECCAKCMRLHCHHRDNKNPYMDRAGCPNFTEFWPPRVCGNCDNSCSNSVDKKACSQWTPQ